MYFDETYFFKMLMNVFNLDVSLSSTPLGGEAVGVGALDVCVEVGADTAGDCPDEEDGIFATMVYGRIELLAACSVVYAGILGDV